MAQVAHDFVRGNNVLIGVTAADGVNFCAGFLCLPRAEERYY
jgi:hypothetical protein